MLFRPILEAYVKSRFHCPLLLVSGLLLLFCWTSWIHAAQPPASVKVDWQKVIRTSRTSVSVQVCVEPPLLRGTATHDQLFKDLYDLHVSYARLQPWFPYPKLAVAELKAPADGRTFWDFSLIDPYVIDFMKATAGHLVDFDFGTIPEWMWKTKKPVPYPASPSNIDWTYDQGTRLRDPSMKEVADYYARLASWYTKGGFTDELGKWHASGHHFKIAYWEVLNEVDLEHRMSPQFYTRLYDAIVEKVRQVSPNTKFIGMALSDPINRPDFFQYFLDHKNHKPGIPLDMISYHFYTMPDPDETPQTWQYTIFKEADTFLCAVRYIESIRKRLSPETGTYIDELGSMLPDPESPTLAHPIPNSYWNLAGAMWAYVYGHLARMGIDAVGGAELIDYPGQFAATTLDDWSTGRPTARYWVLKLLRDNFGPGDKLVPARIETSSLFGYPYVYIQGFITPDGKHRILLVNKRDRTFEISIPDGKRAQVEIVDQATGSDPPATGRLPGNNLTLPGLAVAVVTLAR
jgi:hypothetical protein